MPPVVMASAALDADAPFALALLCAVLGGIEALRGFRLRREATKERDIEMALGGIIAGLIFVEIFIAFVAIGIALGLPFVTLPTLTSWSDWLYLVLFFVPLVLEGCIFVGELRTLRRVSR